MTQDYNPVRERRAMLAEMTPFLSDGIYFFCSTNDPAVAAAAALDSLATFREVEGITLVLNETAATKHGFDLSMPMSRIVLMVFSALDGVGLTAGVATALADQGIPCNMIAAYYHDHVFVPERMRHHAIEILNEVQRDASKPAD